MPIEAADAIHSRRAETTSTNGVQGRIEFAIGVDHAERVLRAELTGNAQNSELGRLSFQWIEVRDDLAGCAIVGVQSSDGPKTDLSCSTRAVEWIGDSPGKDEVDGREEVAGIFDKERTLFREERLEALI